MKLLRFLWLVVLVTLYTPRLAFDWLVEKVREAAELVKLAWNHCA